MRTYWFTVAVGRKYRAEARDLVASARRHGVDIHVLDETIERRFHQHPKSLKFQGILEAPDWADRIVFLDTDTLLLDPTGHEEQIGSVAEAWTRPDSRMVGKANVAAYDELVSTGYPGFQHSAMRHRSWNSGVIMGPTSFMMILASRWRRAWDQVLEVTKGVVHRDQASYRLAYYDSCVAEFGEGQYELPREWNWILKRWGVRDDVHIIHASGEPMGEKKWQAWLQLKEHTIGHPGLNPSFLSWPGYWPRRG